MAKIYLVAGHGGSDPGDVYKRQHSESADQIQQALATVSEGMLTATNANREQLTQQVSDLENNAAMMLAACLLYTSGV